MQQLNLAEDLKNYPTTTRVQEIKGKKYVVVSVYAGTKDFKTTFGDIAFRQVLADMNSENR